MPEAVKLDKYFQAIRRANAFTMRGRISQVVGLTIEAQGPRAALGELCYIKNPHSDLTLIPAEVVGFRGNRTLLMPLGEMDGISPGCEIFATGKKLEVHVSYGMVGRVLDGLGQPIDEKGQLEREASYPVTNRAPNPLERRRISKALTVGIRAIDGLLTIGQGQRMGIFAGSGVGKSTLLGMIARNTDADINVIGLIGERGREVREFLEKDLGEEGLKRSVVVVATSDQPALVRIKGANLATSIAEYYRDKGHNVLLLMDSLTRFALAQREVGLAIGEPPATRGYTPSVFASLPRLLERAGTSAQGSITGLYTVLVEGDDMNEPVADAVRGIIDGHIVLSRDLAALGRYPAIDVLMSVSRCMSDVVSDDHQNYANRFRSLLAVYQEAKDLIEIGAYKKGSNARIDEAINYHEEIENFLRQGVHEKSDMNMVMNEYIRMFGE